MKQPRKKFHAKFTLKKQLTRGGRKADSNYYKRGIAEKKIPYISHLAERLDQLIVVTSMTLPKYKPGLIDRFLVFASREKLLVKILMTKIDLVDDVILASRREVYEALNYEVVPVCNVDKRGIERVKALLKNKRSAVVGHSGVGKTATLNHVDPSFSQKISEISSFTQRGRHTTTRIFLHVLCFGGEIFDMPGLKEMEFIDLSKRELASHYPEILLLLKSVIFRIVFTCMKKIVR